MKLISLFSICALVFLVQNVNSKPDYFTAFVIRIGINTALASLRRLSSITLLRKISLSTPSIISPVITDTFEIKNVSIYGFSTLKYNTRVFVDNEVENNVTVRTINVNLNTSLAEFGINAEYLKDIKVFTLFHVYGEGDFRFGIDNIVLKLNVTLNNRGSLHIQDLKIKLSFGGSNGTHITGFQKNKTLSKYLTAIIKNLQRNFYFWYYRNKICTECFLSESLKFGTNILLRQKAVKYNRCRCLKENGSEIIRKLENIIEMLQDGKLSKKFPLTPQLKNQLIQMVKNVLKQNNITAMYFDNVQNLLNLFSINSIVI
ncbi:uncharacterized protein LOC114329890 [Diabrotica virgifera virgifera]|uniref:Uncharacterized protein LOC114329890 n=1 Tax=Diabrotica virgifera virgifera TaxID=50390 RepID=A0A6P7FPM2_DIAVI|nr:uncharacterized protein LOC114329890 [Diabrotica virgifera virgifera]